jgi:activator of HSP90 ATPase
MQYTRAKATSEPREGGEFSILDGRIVGRYVSLRPGQYIKMEWRFNDWKENSIVEIMLQDPEEDECDVHLTHTRIPASEKKEKIEFGWKEYYFKAMNKLLGYAEKD